MNDRHTLQAEGKHPAPCAKFCEANAFYIEARQQRSHIEELEQEAKLMRARNERLEAEVVELRKDAERYRWLRMQHWDDSEMCVVKQPGNAIKLGYDCPSGTRLDATIDAARTALESKHD